MFVGAKLDETPAPAPAPAPASLLLAAPAAIVGMDTVSFLI